VICTPKLSKNWFNYYSSDVKISSNYFSALKLNSSSLSSLASTEQSEQIELSHKFAAYNF